MQYWVMKEDPHPPERTALIFEVKFEENTPPVFVVLKWNTRSFN